MHGGSGESEGGHIPQEEYPEKTVQVIIDFVEGRPIKETPVPETATESEISHPSK